MMFNLFENIEHSDYSTVYVNHELVNRLNELEISYNVTNEVESFKNLVNMSTSKEKPYHRWVRYREGYSGDLVKVLLERSNLDLEQHFIYDPMCGSGSTLLASIESGFDTLGNDVNPYAVDVCNLKTTHLTEDVFHAIDKFIKYSQIDKIKDKTKSKNISHNLLQIKKYFQELNFEQFVLIDNTIKTVRNDKARQLLRTILLTILEEVSDRKKDGNGLAKQTSKVNNVWQHFVLQTEKILSDVKRYPLPSKPKKNISCASAISASEIITQFSKDTGKKLGAIIFSPPYANSFDYFESYKLELLYGYYTQHEFIKARETAVRNYRKGYGYQLDTDLELVEMLCTEVRIKIPIKEKKTGRKDNRSRLVPNLLIGYFEDMRKILKGFSDAAPSGSYCHIVVDQSSYLGVIIPTDIVLAYIGQMHGYEVQKIIRCRNARTSPQQMKSYPYLKYMLRESIVTLKKS